MDKPYNIAIDCLDKHALSLENKNTTALTIAKASAKGVSFQDFTFSTLARMSNRMAHGLQSLKLPPRSRVVLRLPNSVEFPLAFIGAMKAGLIPIPSSPLLTGSELEFILRDSQAAVLVTTAELLPELNVSTQHIIIVGAGCPRPQLNSRDGRGHPAPTICLFSELIKNAAPEFETAPTRANDPAYWMYTSGTAGTPKAVIHAHRSIPAHDERIKLWQDLQRGDVVFNTSAMNWSYALTAGMLDCWRHGTGVVSYEGPMEARLLAEIICKKRVTSLLTVPGIYRRLVRFLANEGESATVGLQKLRVALSAGESLAAATRERFRQHTGLTIREGLGMTEHSVYLVQAVDQALVPGSCGRPLPGQRIDVLQEASSKGVLQYASTGPNEMGILATHYTCPGLMLGYHGQSEAETFQGGWFLSGDLAKRDAEGNFFFLGRRDDVITAGGYRISPLEVEAVLNQCPLVAEAAVIGKPVVDDKIIVCAYVVLVETATVAQQDEIMAYAREHLAGYKVPRDVIVTKALPKTRNGKLKRLELRTDNA